MGLWQNQVAPEGQFAPSLLSARGEMGNVCWGGRWGGGMGNLLPFAWEGQFAPSLLSGGMGNVRSICLVRCPLSRHCEREARGNPQFGQWIAAPPAAARNDGCRPAGQAYANPGWNWECDKSYRHVCHEAICSLLTWKDSLPRPFCPFVAGAHEKKRRPMPQIHKILYFV